VLPGSARLCPRFGSRSRREDRRIGP
jgi:hypothetical protein